MDVIEEQKTEHQRTVEFFDSRTPEDPAYYSPSVMDVHNESYTRIDTKRGREMLEKLKNMEWKEVLREYLHNWIKGMQMLHVVSTDFNTGNSSPCQYGWYPHGYMDVALQKLLEMVRAEVWLTDAKDEVSISYNALTVTRDLGYGKNVRRTISLDIDFDVSGNKKGFKYKASAKASGDNGFYDEFVQIAKNILAEMDTFKMEPLLKTDMRPYATYQDVASFKDKKDQLGIVKYYLRNDTEGRRDNIKFTQGFIDAYYAAMAFCKALPQVKFSKDRTAFTYKGNEYTAVQYDNLYDGFPDELQYLWQLAQSVLVYKYGLLDTMLDYRFEKDTDVRQFIWHWRDDLHQPITDDIKAWVDRWIPKDRQKYVWSE
jgi:hypothetical protein